MIAQSVAWTTNEQRRNDEDQRLLRNSSSSTTRRNSLSSGMSPVKSTLSSKSLTNTVHSTSYVKNVKHKGGSKERRCFVEESVSSWLDDEFNNLLKSTHSRRGEKWNEDEAAAEGRQYDDSSIGDSSFDSSLDLSEIQSIFEEEVVEETESEDVAAEEDGSQFFEMELSRRDVTLSPITCKDSSFAKLALSSFSSLAELTFS